MPNCYLMYKYFGEKNLAAENKITKISHFVHIQKEVIEGAKGAHNYRIVNRYSVEKACISPENLSCMMGNFHF